VKVLTVKSVDILDEEMQNEVHYALGMHHYTDYVFRPRGAKRYSATIVMEETGEVIGNITAGSASVPGREFVIDDLDMEANLIERFRLKEGKVITHRQSGWTWEE